MKNNKGITLVALTITIIVLLIIASISITGIVLDMNSVNENIMQTELTVLQNAILQRYTKYTLSQNSSILVGSTVTDLNNGDWTGLGITDTTDYKQLSESDLANLGIKDYKTDYIYIVNYKNGDVIIKTPDGKLHSI